MVVIRLAERSEIEWINKCYDDVEFVHSNFDKEIIAIAEVNGEKAGLGRLVTIDGENLELGGMYVFEAFRRLGIARKIVDFLLRYASASQSTYCIPFEHLITFYKQSGFVPCTNFEQVPKELFEKYLWCKEKYPQPTSLLVLEKIDK
jgi:GNAT superfamily N-acetyltransferase